MTMEIKVPALGESVTEATVAQWLKTVGDAVAVDEPLVELETDKVTLEVNAAVAGTLAEIAAGEGANVEVGALLGRITEGNGATVTAPPPASPPKAPEPEAPAPEAALPEPPPPAAVAEAAPALSPAVRKLVEENSVDPASVPATGKGGRLTKGDVLDFIETGKQPAVEAKAAPAPAPSPAPGPAAAPAEREERVRMSRLRQRIAQRLKDAQNTAAMLTTYNEADMSAVMALRREYGESFEKKYGIRLGFMSFFVKAAIVALRDVPAVNAEIDGDEIVYKNHYDIGVAVGTEKGLVVPVLRDADRLGLAEIEGRIGELAGKARDGKLAVDDLTGGTFTISNGGVYGSLMSSPILNPPQSGILGMHKIQKRPVVIDDEIAARPMMYLALSYDHRVVDGAESVRFLVRIKECIEDPRRVLLDL